MTGSSNGEVSDVANLDRGRAGEPIADGDATACYPEGESEKVQEPEPEAGPNANPHRDQYTR